MIPLTCYTYHLPIPLSDDPLRRREHARDAATHARPARRHPDVACPRVESSRAQGPRPMRPPAHAPPAPDRALTRAASSLGQPRPMGRYALANRPCIPHRFACEGQQPGWARAQREAFAAARGYGGPEEGVAVPAVVPPQSRHMREARAWPATIYSSRRLSRANTRA